MVEQNPERPSAPRVVPLVYAEAYNSFIDALPQKDKETRVIVAGEVVSQAEMGKRLLSDDPVGRYFFEQVDMLATREEMEEKGLKPTKDEVLNEAIKGFKEATKQLKDELGLV